MAKKRKFSDKEIYGGMSKRKRKQKLVADVFDGRLVRHIPACLAAAKKKAPRGATVKLDRKGFPVMHYTADEGVSLKVFDTFENCLHKKKPRGKYPCAGMSAKKFNACRAKLEKTTKADWVKVRKTFKK